MATFEKAIQTIFKHEGFRSDNPNDRGGITQYGISLRFLLSATQVSNDDNFLDGDINHDGVIDVNDIKAMSKKDAETLYRLYFWERNSYDLISDQSIATKIFDLCVNMGAIPANTIAQQSILAVLGLVLQQDGIMGIKTITAINMCKPNELMVALKANAACYYLSLIAKNPKLQVFKNGWLNRAFANPLD